MADLVITTSQIVQSTTSSDIEFGVAGEAITAGQPVYKKASDGKMYKADANASADTAAAKGIATCDANAAGVAIAWQKSGTITIGAAASITAGATYWVSATAGGICPEADLTTGHYATFLGVGNASNAIVMPTQGPVVSGVAHA